MTDEAHVMELSAKLQEPFHEDDVEWRVSRSGKTKAGKPWAKVLAYITSRAIQERLDHLFGPDRWTNDFRPGPDGGVVCGIGIRFPGSDEWVWKFDGAPNTDIEPVKGGISDAMKRAGVQWGIGRYLYQLDEGFASFTDSPRDGKYTAKIEGAFFGWNPPTLPRWALPGGEGRPARSGSTSRASKPEESKGASSTPAETPTLTPAPDPEELREAIRLAREIAAESGIPPRVIVRELRESHGVGKVAELGKLPNAMDSVTSFLQWIEMQKERSN